MKRNKTGGMVIGNISQLSKSARQRLLPKLGLGQSLQRLTTTAVTRGEAQAKAAIEAAIPDPGALADDLSPAEQEQFVQGLEMMMGALHHARGRNARLARETIEGLYHAVAGFEDSVDGDYAEYDEEYGDTSAAGVDVIGLDASGGLVRPSDPDEWR